MPRHPAEQFRNRMDELAPVLTSRTLTMMNEQVEVYRIEQTLAKARAKRDEAILKVKEAEAAQQILINRCGNGLFPWGLPEGITREQWLELTGRALEGGPR